MLDSKVALDVIAHGMALGADFCELFIENTRVQNITVLNSKADKVSSGIDCGIGIRLIYGTQVLYGYTNSFEREELLRITSLIAARNKRDKVRDALNLNFCKPNNIHIADHTLLNDVTVEEKVDFLMKIDRAARNRSNAVKQVRVNNAQWCQNIEIFNSEGLHAQDERNYFRIGSAATAEKNGAQEDGGDNKGCLGGWERIRNYDPIQWGERITDQALTMLEAELCPAGNMPVIIGNGFGGVIFHEACGHSLETTSVAKKESVFADRMGDMIASECVNAIDDGTMPNEWGSCNIDDEGAPMKRTQLITNGKLTSFLVDKVGALKTGYEITGSGRRQNYKYAPTSRMRNTYIAPGKDKFEDMIASVENGIYAKKMGGGSVSPGTGEFNFAIYEGYMIKNGKIDKPVKSATLIGTGEEILKNISMVSDDLEHAPGMCGSSSGSVPTNVGQPSLKVDGILVGGKA